MLGQETGKSFEFCQMLINTWSVLFENTTWNDLFRWWTVLIWWPLTVLSCFVFSEKWLFCKTSWYLVLAKLFWMPMLTKKLVNSHDVIDTNDDSHFLSTGEKLPPVLLQIDVALLDRYLNQNIKINNLFINIESGSTFVKLVINSALKSCSNTYTTTNKFDGLELQNVYENPKTHIQKL